VTVGDEDAILPGLMGIMGMAWLRGFRTCRALHSTTRTIWLVLMGLDQ